MAFNILKKHICGHYLISVHAYKEDSFRIADLITLSNKYCIIYKTLLYQLKMGWVVMKTQEDLRLSLIMHGKGGGAMSSIGVISFMLYS